MWLVWWINKRIDRGIEGEIRKIKKIEIEIKKNRKNKRI
jgi:hypothetical protein